MADTKFAEQIARIQHGYLEPAVEAASNVDGMPLDAVLVALCEAALTSCFVLADGKAPEAADYYRAIRDEALELYVKREMAFDG